MSESKSKDLEYKSNTGRIFVGASKEGPLREIASDFDFRKLKMTYEFLPAPGARRQTRRMTKLIAIEK